MNIALVGGGNASILFMDNIRELKEYTVAMVCDIRADAPGIVRAREEGIPTTTELEDVTSSDDIKIILEITGNEKVFQTLQDTIQDHQILISAETAKLMFDIIEHHDAAMQASNKRFGSAFDGFVNTFTLSVAPIDESHSQLHQLLRQITFINLNAKIEAVKVGERAAAFGVVIDELAKIIKYIDSSIGLIDNGLGSIKESIASVKRTRSELLGDEA